MPKRGIIRKSDVITEDALKPFKELRGELNQILDLMDKLIGKGKVFAKNTSGAKNVNELGEATKKAATNTEQLTVEEKELIKINNQLLQSEAQLGAKYQEQDKLLQKNRAEKQKNRKETKAIELANKAAKGSYEAINVSLNKNIARYKTLTEAERNNKKVGGELIKTIQKQDMALKKLDASMGRSQRNVGNYRGALNRLVSSGRGLASAFGAVGGAFLFAKVIKDSIGIMITFEKTMSEVEAITGATDKQMVQLSKDALKLGSSTKFTATEVGKLQVEYGRLGFTTSEILAATEATLDLAAATNSDLATSAEVAGNTVRAFGLNASETQRVVDVMAKSFNSTALNLERFSTAMGVVAPVAKSAGVSLERTTALMGVLANRGVDASTAGTSLRNIFLELSVQGITFEEAMNKINSSVDRNATAFDLFGKRGSTAANIIAGVEEETSKLTETFDDASGSAKKMADIVQDNLAGELTRLKSVWEGLILKGREGVSVFREAVKFFQTTLVVLGNLDLVFTRTSKLTEDQIERNFDALLAMTNKKSRKFGEIVEKFDKVEGDRVKFIEKRFLDEIEGIGFTRKQAVVLWEEYLRRRKEQQQEEIKAEEETSKVLEDKKIADALKAELIANEAADTKADKQKEINKVRAKAQLEFDKLSASAVIRNNIAIIKSELSTTKAKDQALKENEAKTIEFAERQSEIELNALKDRKDLLLINEEEYALQVKIINAKLDNEILKAKEKTAQKREDIDEKEIKVLVALGKEFNEKRLADIEAQTNRELQFLTDKFNAGLITQKEFETQRKQIIFDADNEILTEKLTILKNELKNIELTDLQKAEILRDIAGLELELIDLVREKKDEENEKDKEDLDQKLEDQKRINEQIIQLATETVQSLFEVRANGIGAEIAAIEKQKADELAIAGDTKDARKNIDEKYQDELNALKLKEAKNERSAALFSIAISTAKASVEALPNFLLVALTIASGLAAAAVVLSRPLPEFWKGTKNSPEGPAWVAERGPEAVIEPSGKTSIAEKPQIRHLKKGSIVKTAIDTERMLSQAFVNGNINFDSKELKNAYEFKKMGKEIVESNQAIADEIRKKPVPSLHIDENGIPLWYFNDGLVVKKRHDSKFKY